MRDRLEAAAPNVTERTLSRDPDASDATLALLTAATSVVQSACPAVTADDRAMALVVQRPRM